MSEAAASTSKWDAGDYARVGSFVAELGQAAHDLLDPQPGERILDVGCGEGAMTRKIMDRGATVLGVDNSSEMVAAAREKGVDALLLAAEDMQFFAEFGDEAAEARVISRVPFAGRGSGLAQRVFTQSR